MARPKFTMDAPATTAAQAQEIPPANTTPEISPDLNVKVEGAVTVPAAIPVTKPVENITPIMPSGVSPETLPAAQESVPPAPVPVTPEPPASAPVATKKDAPVPMKYVMPVFSITDSKVTATKCEFSVSAKVFSTFLKSISLGKMIKDSYLEILPNDTMISAFAEPASQSLLGFLAVDSIKSVTPGRLLLTNMDKLASVVKTLEGKSDDITISYDEGKITIKSPKAKRDIELTGVQEQYVTSLKGLVNKVIDIENKKIGKLDFSDFTQFETDISMFTDILEAAKAINLPGYRFEVKEGSPAIDVVITNAQDKYALTFEPQNYIRNGAFNVTFSPGVAEVVGLFTGTVKVFLSPNCIIIGQHNMWYLIMPVG